MADEDEGGPTPEVLVLFGATGDLAGRMLFPSLYRLDADHRLTRGLRIVGVARSELSREDLVAKGAVRDGHLVKVLGSGEITVAVNVTANAFSGSAKEKIEAAGGTCDVIE